MEEEIDDIPIAGSPPLQRFMEEGTKPFRPWVRLGPTIREKCLLILFSGAEEHVPLAGRYFPVVSLVTRHQVRSDGWPAR